MEGHAHDRLRHLTAVVFGGLSAALLAPAASAAPAASVDGPATLPACSESFVAEGDDGEVVVPWQVELDDDGAVSGHRMILRRRGQETTIRTGRRGFSVAVGGGRLLIGERSADGTHLSMIDTRRACRLWTRQLDWLAYGAEVSADGTAVRMASHEPGTRLFLGISVIDADTGASGGMIDGECITECEPNDGEIPPAAFEPAGAARPVPSFPAGGWVRDKTLPFRWRSGAVPPDWAKGPLKAAAEDAWATSRSRSPQFVYRSSAGDTVRYTGSFPSFCRTGIACASRNKPAYWAVWLRPHGTDFSWGTLRWCQKRSTTGCFDIRRVMLHELGHIAGLHHPSSAGFRLETPLTVMHAITPAKPAAGSTRHTFGRCDVATLQELYGLRTDRTAVSTCNDVPTSLTLTAGRSAVTAGESVKLKARLRVASGSAYGLLADTPLDGRTVKLKYRRAGSDDAWTTAWMKSLDTSGRYVLSIEPQATWEFMAAFPAPADEGLRYSRSPIVKVRVTR